MVAFMRGRRQNSPQPVAVRTPMEALLSGSAAAANGHFEGAGSYRAVRRVEVRHDAEGGIAEVRIGRWRTITAGPCRKLAEVRELSCRRVAVRIERTTDGSGTPSSEIWQLYDLDGRLEAALQTTPDGRFALMTNYQTRQACRLAANGQGELRAVETWRI